MSNEDISKIFDDIPEQIFKSISDSCNKQESEIFEKKKVQAFIIPKRSVVFSDMTRVQ